MDAGNHPVDRPALSALTTRQAHLAVVDGPAIRFDPAYALFAAVQDEAADWTALARLARTTGPVALFEAEAAVPPGFKQIDHFPCLQMTCDALTPGGRSVDFETLTDADGPEMLALATLTRPGPFLERPIVSVRSSACGGKAGSSPWLASGSISTGTARSVGSAPTPTGGAGASPAP